MRKEKISWQDFEKVDIRVGTILEVQVFEEARSPAYKLLIDFGEQIGIKKSSAQITALYDVAELVGQQIIAVVNFPAKQIGPMMSECLVLGVYNDGQQVVLLKPERPIENGCKIG